MTLRVKATGDWHIGDPNFQEKKLLEDLYSCKYEPTVLILTGDLLNNAIKSSVSNCYEEIIPAGKPQIDYLVNLLSPYRQHIGLVIPGNHERRTTKDVNIDVAEIYSKYLGIPYASPHALLKIQFGKNSKGDPINYVAYAHHGGGGGRARSGKTKKMVDQEWMVNGCDLYLRAHTHILDAFPLEIVTPDVRALTVHRNTSYHVSTGTYLDTSEYAETMELPPLTIGSPDIYLSGREKQIRIKL